MSEFSTTGGRPAAHTSTVSTPSENPAHTDWRAIGLPDHSPFDILSRPRAVPNAAAKPPRKRGPKPSAAQRTIASLRDLPGPARFCTDIMSREESDRTASIRMGVV